MPRTRSAATELRHALSKITELHARLADTDAQLTRALRKASDLETWSKKLVTDCEDLTARLKRAETRIDDLLHIARHGPKRE